MKKTQLEKIIATKINTRCEKERLPNIVAAVAFVAFVLGPRFASPSGGIVSGSETAALELDTGAAPAQLLYKMCAANESEIIPRVADKRTAREVQKVSEVKG